MRSPVDHPQIRGPESSNGALTQLLASVPAALNDPAQSTLRKRKCQATLEPTKKRATSAREDNLAKQFRNHERFWLADGNTVIELDEIRYRVHQSWLTQHSEQIAAMFLDRGKFGDKLEEITLDFCGKLKAVDFETLLLFYANPGDYRHAIEPVTLMSLIRATTFLGFDSDRVWLVKELEALWRYNLEELSPKPELHLNAPEVAALARACDIDGLLKPVFYDMARTPVFGLDKLEESEQIGRADMLRLIRMREYLSDMWAQAAVRENPTLVCQNLLGVPSIDGEGTSILSEHADEKPALCATTSASTINKCLSATARREAWVRLVHDSGIFTRYRYDPLCGLAALITIEWTFDWCKDCKEKRKVDWRQMQSSIWEKVGEYLIEE
ncbi:hypothetical protein DEU56DRAFT_809341 [Suillus clintonianus]|uniref:uncharacterized protein n=1 Tax=Suillus clintonianus TaxID=1904413 RepID=UPI001B87840D|nr:uncharacterized protein DEU56DRAFT_809341 [Suillus clintonianus]KAG2134487.1 hypothetical protein DEU56DRAFT_809341 [Suillus clintonianus]